MRHLITLFLVLLLFGCSPEKKSRKKLGSLREADQNQKYEVGMACMQYITQYGNDLAYSRTLVNKLLEMGFSSEAIYAVELLEKKFPADPELFYLRGRAYRNQHQYNLALQDLHDAVKLQPRDNSFSAEAQSTEEEQLRWNEIQSLNEMLAHSTDSFDILFQRAEMFFVIREYDAVLYDLGSISKMRSSADSIYFSEKVSDLYKDNQRPVEKLSEMLAHFRVLKEQK